MEKEDVCKVKFEDREYSGKFLGVDDGFVFLTSGEKHIALNLEYVTELTINGNRVFFFFLKEGSEALVPVSLKDKLVDISQLRPPDQYVDIVTVEKIKTDVVNQITAVKDEQIRQLAQELASLKQQLNDLSTENARLKQELALYESGEKLAPSVKEKLDAYQRKLASIEAKLKNISELLPKDFMLQKVGQSQPSPQPATPPSSQQGQSDPPSTDLKAIHEDMKELYKKMLRVVSSPGTSRRPKPQLQEGRASTGVEQLDKLLKGGLTYGNSVLVTYENFTYGDLLSVYLLRGGIDSKEKVYLVLNGIDEEAFWQMTKKTYVKFEPEEIFDLKGKGILKVMQAQDFNEFQMLVDEYINAPKDEASRMIVYTINSFIYSENFINFITQFSSLKYMFDGTKKNIFLFLTEYSDRSDLQRVYSICKGIIQFKVQELEDRINLRLRVQGLSNEVQSWLGYYITDDGAFQIESPNIRRV